MRLALLPLVLALSACSSTPTDLLMEELPTDGTEAEEVVARAAFEGVGSYRAAGDVVVYRQDDGSHVVRFEGLDTEAGPDLKVWLVERFEGDVVDGHVALGELRSTRGDQNYDVPDGVDPTAFAGVSIWCERFGVGFGAAPFE